MTWLEFKQLVLDNMTDTAPASGSDVLFVEAVAEYVNCRARRELSGSASQAVLASAKTHENSYRRLRRKLAGRETSLDASALNAAVRVRLTDSDITDATAARAVAYKVKAELAREIDGDPDLAEVWERNYQALRIRLLGYTITANDAALRTLVDNYLPADDDRQNAQEFIDAHLVSAKADIDALKGYVDSIITAGAEDLVAVKTRVDVEIINGIVHLQNLIPGLRDRNFTTYTFEDGTDEGFATRLSLPDNSRPIAAWIIYTADEETESTDDDQLLCSRVACIQIPERDIQEKMICRQACDAQVGFNEAGRCFYVTPLLVEDEIEFQLKWSGIKEDYEDTDTVEFSREVAQAVATYVSSKLAGADGDAGAMSYAEMELLKIKRSIYRETRDERNLEFVN